MICVYDRTNSNYNGNGDVVLQPLECSHTQAAAGAYDLELRCPLDPQGKWQHLIPEAIIRAPVPEEKIETAYSGLDVDLYRTTTTAPMRTEPSEPTAIYYSTWDPYGNTYQVGDKVSVSGSYSHRNYQCVQWVSGDPQSVIPPYASSWWKAIADTTSGAPVIVNLKPDTDLYYVSGPSDGWYEMSTTYGLDGYIKASQVEFVRHLSPSETQPRVITTQLFRIKTVNVDTKGGTITAHAEHVSYDLSGVLVEDAEIHQKNPAMALAWIEQSFMIDYRGTIATNMTADTDGLYNGDIKGKNGIYALLDPDKGIVKTFGAMYRRDNWDVFIMRKTQTDRGFRLRYGKNLLGVTWNIKSDNLVTRVVPVAKAADGSDLYLDGTRWVDSAHISEYDQIYMERLKVAGQVGKDDGTETGTNWTETTLRAEMARQAQARFDVDHADLIVHEITVDFEALGDTEEHKALKGLEQVLMYDTVIAVDERIGLSVSVEVNEIEYDCIRQKVKAVKLTNVQAYGGRTVSGFNVFNNSITGDKLTDDVSDQMTGGILDDANSYTDNQVNSMNYSLRGWVTANFEPKASE